MASISIPASVPISVSEKVYRTPTSSVPAVVGPISTPPCAPKIDSSTSITPKRLLNSPGKERIREAHRLQVKSLRRQLYNSRQQQVRYKKRIVTLEAVLRSLKQKNLLSSEDLEIIENFTPVNKGESIYFS